MQHDHKSLMGSPCRSIFYGAQLVPSRISHKDFLHDFNFPVRLNISERLKHPGAPFFLAVSTGRLNTRS